MTILPLHILRKMGYLADRKGVAERYLHNSRAWEDHLRQTKEFILSCMPEGRMGIIAILGSGWLLDLPLEEIVHAADQIYLYDIVHPPQVIHRIGRYDNITAVTEDLTGGAVLAAYQAVRAYKKTRKKPEITDLIPSFMPSIKADFMVSLNILSQLGAMVTEYLSRHIPYSSAEENEINRFIQAGHLRLLQGTASCLITDYEEVATDLQTGRQQSRRLVLADLPFADRSVEWDWDFDPDGGYYQGMKVVLKVMAKVFI